MEEWIEELFETGYRFEKHWSRDVRNIKEKCLDEISTRDYRVNGRCMTIWSIGWTCFDIL